MDKRKRTKSDLQNIIQKTKEVRALRTSLKTGGELRCSGRVCSSCSTCDIRRVIVKRDEYTSFAIEIVLDYNTRK